VKIYTDGSKLNEVAGAGLVVRETPDTGEEYTTQQATQYLGQWATVFQAEVTAIEMAGDLALAMKVNKPVVICSDSQAAIQAIGNPLIRSKTVLSANRSLRALGRTTGVTLRWIRAHENHRGNELADGAAKEATKERIMVAEPVLPLAANVVRGILRDAVAAKWEKKWNSTRKYRQTRIFFPVPCARRANKLIKYGKREVGQAVRYITGFAFLRRHQSLIDRRNSTCRLCGMDPESSWHIMADCEAIHVIRLASFKLSFNSDPMVWEPKELISLLRQPRVRELEDMLDE
jgi:ribonuclease HI